MEEFTDPGPISLGEYVLGAPPDLGAVAVVDYTRGYRRDVTYGELVGAVRTLAARLRALGVVDRTVAVLVENSVEFVVAYHGVLAAGGVVLALDPRDERHRAGAIDAAAAAALVVGAVPGVPDSVLPPDRTVGVELPPPRTSIATDGEIVAVPGGDRPAVVLSSSGTTGTPRNVTVTHHNLVANLAQIHAVHRVHPGETVVAVPPLRHIYGMQMAMNPVLRAGATLVLVATPLSVRDLLDRLNVHRVAVAYLVPSVLAEIARDTATSEFPALRRVVSGGAPLPEPVAREAAERLGTPVVQGFGMTEAGCLFFTPDDRAVPTGSVGVAVPGTRVRVVDAGTGRDVADGQVGELWVRGPQVVPAGAEPSMSRTADGWLRTGDLIVRDPDGFVRIVGRIKAMIKYKGHQVSPAVLEERLLTHPAVRAASVTGIADPIAGELPKAHVVVDGDVPLADIVRHVNEHAAAPQRVRLIERVHAIGLSATGKPQPPPPIRVLVTGAGRGLGRAFALALARSGASVLAVARDEAAVLDLVRSIREAGGTACSAVADILDAGQFGRAVADLTAVAGGIDVLVNNAGVPGPLGPLWEVDERDWWHTMEVNLRGALLTIRTVLPHLGDRGRVINIVSRAGVRGWPHAGAYAVSKAALISLTANLAGELRGTGTTTVAFDPGLVDIGITRAHLDRGRTGDHWPDRILEWAERARDNGGFTAVDDSTRALVDIAFGSADHLTGRYVTVDEVRIHASRGSRAPSP